MDKVLKEFAVLVKKPESFLRLDDGSCNRLKSITKNIFDYGASCAKNKSALPIHELIVEGFDDEQVWQELELLNGLEWPTLTREVSRAAARGRQLRLPVQPAAAGSDDDQGAEGSDAHGAYEEGASAEPTDAENLSDNQSLDAENELADSDSDEDDEQRSEDDEEGGDESGGEEPMPERPCGRRSAVDDRFFRLEELDQFLERQDRHFDRERVRKPDQNDQTGIDLFTEDAGDEDEVGAEEDEQTMPMFSDFFDPPVGDGKQTEEQSKQDGMKNNKKDLLASDSEDEDSRGGKKEEPKSTLEARQERLKSRISQLEEQNLAEKPWQQRGETSAATRHENALLEEYVDFEQTRRAPETTAEVTAEIERLILRRIRDAAFDDVERKVKPIADPYDFKKRLVLDQEKSKLSLAQIYEQEYLKQKSEAEARPEVDLSMAHDEVEDIPKEHEEIKRLMNDLFAKLDTLTHFHYQPKQASAEVRIISKLPSIAMEEITALGASNATLLAPEEVKDKKRSQLLAKEERTDTDKKRERRKKKHRQSLKAKAKELKERTLAAQAPEKRSGSASRQLAAAQVARAARRGTVTKSDGKGDKRALKSSSAFFSQLQDQVASQLEGSQPVKKKRKKATPEDVARMRL